VARHIAIALGNARLLEDIRRRGDELETLLEIGRNIVERLDLSELLPLVARSVNRVMGTTHCLLLLRSAADTVEVAAQEGLEREVIEAFRDLRVGQSLSGWVIKEGKLLAVPDMREDPRLRYGDMVVRFDYRSFLGVPLRLGARRWARWRWSPGRAPPLLGRGAGADDRLRAPGGGGHRQRAAVRGGAREPAAGGGDEPPPEELDRLRREYLRNVSHEFRTPRR
jgi:signal transduction histidine kinase